MKFPTPDIWKLVGECVERGILFGYNRAFKHEENPSGEYIKDCIYDSIMNEFGDKFKWE